MFSINPRTGTRSLLKRDTPLLASSNAMSCGVDTTKAPERGMRWARLIWASPVPGGMSTIMTSNLPQSEPMAMRSKAELTMGPRHTAGWSGTMKNAMLMTLTRKFSLGRMRGWGPSLVAGLPCKFIICAMEGPCTSPSSRPTRKFKRVAKATAKLTAVVDLPTPPLADDTATMWSTCARPSFLLLLSPPCCSPAAAVAVLLSRCLKDCPHADKHS
mmetsp:Transcript_14173/g.38398  ORF Transcript_14173/g.38398 Transcript_14173/m.38398 type:complete len:215 (-) Transcript_14173:84-728(-)